MESKEYICINYESCEKAISGESISNLEASKNGFKCEKCNSELQEFESKKGLNLKRPLIIGIPIVIAVIGIIYLLNRGNNELDFDTDDGINVNIPENTQGEIPPFEPTEEIPIPERENVNLDMIEVEINAIGNKNNTSNARLGLIDDYLKYFTRDSDVVILGKNSGGTLDIIPIKDYLERIAYFKTLDGIEVKEMMLNDEGLIWELRIVENHR